MHISTAPVLALAALATISVGPTGVSAGAIVYRPAAATAGALERRQATGSRSSSVSIVTTVPISSAQATATSSAGVWSAASPPPFSYGRPTHDFFGVQGRSRNGLTNPEHPSKDTPVNQSSDARLATLNSVEDWCTFAPEPLNNTQELGSLEQTTVAYCTKPRNNARVIPDGTITAVQFVKTPLYIQLYALGDFTNINMAPGDTGGELDPHGATNMGNPVGGNVTSNVVDGSTDVFYEEVCTTETLYKLPPCTLLLFVRGILTLYRWLCVGVGGTVDELRIFERGMLPSVHRRIRPSDARS